MHTRLTGLVKRVNNLWINERVHLHPDGCWLMSLRIGDLVIDMLQDSRAQGKR
ncbi:hypothetical protein D3C80_1978860 [compost metagenome]